MTEREKHTPTEYRHVSAEELELPTSKLMDLLDAALKGTTVNGQTWRQRYAKESEDQRVMPDVDNAKTDESEQSERLRKITEIESICDDMINRAMMLLTKIPKKYGNSNTYSFVYREAEDAVFGKNKTVSITKMQGGDYGIIRFGFNPSDEANGSIDVILSKTPQGITFEQIRPYETHWRKIENYQGDRTLDHKFRGEYLLQVLSELSQVSQVLTLAEDFAAETE